jgi:hypothetical protein
MKRLSLRPYHGNLFLAKTRREYEKQHIALFKTPDVLSCAQAGRMTGGEGHDGFWTYLIYAEEAPILAHELSHVILDVFQRAGIDPREANGEPFCYMLSQLMLDAQPTKKEH